MGTDYQTEQGSAFQIGRTDEGDLMGVTIVGGDTQGAEMAVLHAAEVEELTLAWEHEELITPIVKRIMAAYPAEGADWAVDQWERAIANLENDEQEFSYRVDNIDAVLASAFGIDGQGVRHD